ncbi:hypothetical protein JNB_03735 [Janibacter sp. HTCC2649]|uniref:hypothetical protein n=1 Tax=Janibacter sp. HTCC2649 TaxID=313589 RepID=UPI000066ED2F|nr:hypothetical protein [Janibacter sp. HTCC2649]EAP99249.1 hypothetical protein JNB_03735 [Janibacter sp. HTCC2649]
MADREAHSTDRRAVRIPGTGAKVCLLIAALLVVAGAYFLLTPLMIMTTNGTSWNCGSAMSPPTDAFGSKICGQLNGAYVARGIACFAAAAVTGVGGFLLFGSVKRIEQRRRSADEPSASASRV